MSGFRTMALWFGAVIALLTGWGAATGASAQCATISAQPVFLAYNPLTAGAKTVDFLITATNNTCGNGAQLNYGFANGHINAGGSQISLLPPLNYSAMLIAPTIGPRILLNIPSPQRVQLGVNLANGQSHQTTVRFQVDPRQALPANNLNASFVIFVYGVGQVRSIDKQATVTVTSGYTMTVGGVGGTGLLDFGVLEADEVVKSVSIHAQATGAYRVTLASEQDGVLRNTATGAGSHTVPYAVTLGGAPINELTPYQAATASGTILLAQGTAILPLINDLDTSGVAGLRAGIYRDILTLTISAQF